MPALRFEFPATSANLGPGFDALALALELILQVEAEPAAETSIAATGRSPEVCAALDHNLLLKTYRDTWSLYRDDPPRPLALRIENGIPLGMGCGSSAASRSAGVALANCFGEQSWDRMRVLDEVAALEHHPDNAAACLLGGFTASGTMPAPAADSPQTPGASARDRVMAVSISPPEAWRALLVLPARPLATTASRGILPDSYSRREIVPNLQNIALLVSAFAGGRGELLAAATRDGLHQPYRGEVCPLLPRLLPLAGTGGILSVTLSGAGSSVLLLLESERVAEDAARRVRAAAAGLEIAELLPARLRTAPALLPVLR